MKKLLFILSMILIIGCTSKEKNLKPERTYVIKHPGGIDTLKAREVYTERLYVIFYSDVMYGQKAGMFDSPYSFKIINL